MAARIVRDREGMRIAPYLDTAGHWTIGNGSTHLADGSPVTASTPPLPDVAAADALMMVELRPTYRAVASLCPAGADPAQVAACTSFAYNEGVSAFAGSTLLHMWLQGDVKGATAQFARWNLEHDPATGQLRVNRGLVNRRAYEAAVFAGTQAPP